MNRPPMEELRQAIRELLAEELARLRGEPVGRAADPPPAPEREERVAIGNDRDLAAFVVRLAGLCADPETRHQIESGRWRFRLAGGAPAGSTPPSASPASSEARFERGLVSEREVQRLAAGIRVVLAAKRVRFTPLAMDLLRRRGITLERTES